MSEVTGETVVEDLVPLSQLSASVMRLINREKFHLWDFKFIPISLCGIAGLAGGPGSGTSLWDLFPGFSLAAGACGGTSCVKVLPS